MTKPEIRARARQRVEGLSLERRRELSARACRLLVNQELWRRAEAVLFYAPLPDELDLAPIWSEALAQGKRVLLPRFKAEDGAYEVCAVDHLDEQCLKRGRFGILEPDDQCPTIPGNQLDLALVPGVAFDLGGRRLGRGRGFYDRLLKHIGGTKCGVGFDEQIELQIPVEPHDERVDCILTPTRWLDCGQSTAVK